MAFCVECGQEVRSNWKFCKFCSSRLEKNAGGLKSSNKDLNLEGNSSLDRLNSRLEALDKVLDRFIDKRDTEEVPNQLQNGTDYQDQKSPPKVSWWVFLAGAMGAFSDGLANAVNSMASNSKPNSEMGFKPNCVRCGTQLASQFSICPYCQKPW